MTDPERLIRDLFAAYLGNDRQRVADALADDFRFTSPFDDDLDKTAYFERCWRDTSWIARHDIERIRRRRRGLRHLSLPGEGRQELSQHRVLHLRRRQGSPHRGLFRRRPAGWALPAAGALAPANNLQNNFRRLSVPSEFVRLG